MSSCSAESLLTTKFQYVCFCESLCGQQLEFVVVGQVAKRRIVVSPNPSYIELRNAVQTKLTTLELLGPGKRFTMVDAQDYEIDGKTGYPPDSLFEEIKVEIYDAGKYSSSRSTSTTIITPSLFDHHYQSRPQIVHVARTLVQHNTLPYPCVPLLWQCKPTNRPHMPTRTYAHPCGCLILPPTWTCDCKPGLCDNGFGKMPLLSQRHDTADV